MKLNVAYFVLAAGLAQAAEGFFAPSSTHLSRRLFGTSRRGGAAAGEPGTRTTTTTMSMKTNTNTNKRPALTQADYRAKLNDGARIQSADVATLPRPGTSTPSSIHIHNVNNDDAWITYLSPDPKEPNSLTRKLWATHVTSGKTVELFQPGNAGKEEDFSLEEKLRRERARMMTTGATSYAWAAGGAASAGGGTSNAKMIVPLGGALWILENPLGSANDDGAATIEPIKLIETNTGDSTSNSVLPLNAPLLDAKISSDGSTVAFVADDEVYVMSTTTGDTAVVPKQVTTGARGIDGRSNGVADYVAQEELERSDGFWLSPAGSQIVFEAVDESHIPSYRITHQGEDKGLAPTLDATMTSADVRTASTVTYEEHRYPFAGADNPKFKLGVVQTDSDDAAAGDNNVIWFDLEQIFGDDYYLAKVEWLKPTEGADDSTKVVVQLLDRRQQNLALLLLDTASGTVTTLHMESAIEGAWVNLNGAFRVLSTNESMMQFLWSSERDGYAHLYVMEADTSDKGKANASGAAVVSRLTGPGEFIVEEVLEVDQEKKSVYFMGTSPNQWLEKHLFRVSLEGGSEPECLTASTPGQHSCVVSLKAGVFVDTVSSVEKAPIASVHKLDGKDGSCLLQLHDASEADSRLEALGDDLKPPTFHQFPSTDGNVTLQAAMYLPDEKIHGKGPWPLVVATYGGPHVQYVQNTWGMMTADMRSQFLVANGFAVIKVDNRGSNRRGLVFEAPIFGNMGELEVDDQVAGVQWAVDQGYADKDRVAVSGWSYGGYMALKCLAGRPDVFHAAVSGAPVTDWTLYDTAYTERYMGLPQENPEGYIKSSALGKVGDIEGSLLLCHGLLDENVLFRHSAVLVNELIAKKKAYDLALFPSERHGPRRPQDRAFLEERILAFLQKSLGLL